MNQDELCNIVAEKYYDQIYRYCFSVLNGDKQAAEDCTQETFMIMIKKKKELAFEGNICVWLYKTADRVIKNYVRKEKRRGIRLSIDEVTLTDDGGLSSIEEQSALECLTKDEYRLLTEYYSTDRGKKDILAARYDMTIYDLYKEIDRIKKKIVCKNK